MTRFFGFDSDEVHLINQLLRVIEHYGLASIFLSMVVENIGIPFPTEGAFLVSQQLIQTGRHSFLFMYFFLVFGQVFGAILAYFLGRTINGWLTIRLKNHDGYQKASKSIHGWYARYGSVTVLATRLIGYVRPWSSLVAGAAEFPFWPFLLWTIIGTLLFVYPTMRITALVFLIWRRSPLAHLFISLGFLVSFFGLIIYGVARRSREKSRQTSVVK